MRLIKLTVSSPFAAQSHAYTAKRKKDRIVVRRERRDNEGKVVEPEERKPVSNGEINRELQLLKHMLR